MNNALKDVIVAFADTYTYSNTNTKNTELASLVNQVEK